MGDGCWVAVGSALWVMFRVRIAQVCRAAGNSNLIATSGSPVSQTPLLDDVKTPEDLRRLSEDQLPQLAAELRSEMIDAVSVTGGHLGAGLGVVELTVALHWVFNTPEDRLVWDVGHQAYPHRSSPAGAIASARCASPAGYRDL